MLWYECSDARIRSRTSGLTRVQRRVSTPTVLHLSLGTGRNVYEPRGFSSYLPPRAESFPHSHIESKNEPSSYLISTTSQPATEPPGCTGISGDKGDLTDSSASIFFLDDV